MVRIAYVEEDGLDSQSMIGSVAKTVEDVVCFLS